MQQDEAGLSGSLGPMDWRRILPFEPDASSERLGWVGVQGARYRTARASEFAAPAITHHRLVLFIRPPEELDLQV